MTDPQNLAKDPRQISAAHIKKLSELNATVPPILQSAGQALSSLTNAPITTDSSHLDSSDSIALRKQLLTSSVQTFFQHTSTLARALGDEISALESHKIIPATGTKATSREMTAADAAKYLNPGKEVAPPPGVAPVEKGRDSEATVTNAGLGDLDIGMLNARVGGAKGELEVEGGLVERVRGILGELVREDDQEDEKMSEG